MPTPAESFLVNETQFQLGFLPTEQSNPLTTDLDKRFAADTADGIACLQRVDRDVLAMARRVFASPQYARLADTIEGTLRAGKRVCFSGCGATGRLSILLESMWRKACAETPALAAYADQVFSIMTGGDYAMVRSVEFFEDYQTFGARQVQELGLSEGDTLVAITEGGETSSVLGTVFEALRRGLAVFLLFNNPAEILAEHLERSRKAIRDPRVTVLDLSCGPMALAGSTRMQATTSEQLVAGAALESTACRLAGLPVPDYPAAFAALLADLEQPAARATLADCIDREADLYRGHAFITYFADDYLLDIFTDTTERSPTFKLPPFRPIDDTASPQSWAFVKNPLLPTADAWRHALRRPLRCLTWTIADYEALGAPDNVKAKPPRLDADRLCRIPIGSEALDARLEHGRDEALLVTADDLGNAPLLQEFARLRPRFAAARHLSIGPDAGDLRVPVALPATPLRLISHLAVKLSLNTISTGTMVRMGRVTGNWMSWVDVSNKKLIDRAIRLIVELGHIDYPDACKRLFDAEAALAGTGRPVVPYVLQQLATRQ
jgi:N-acetylmuramic acid 6-phosphate etherase